MSNHYTTVTISEELTSVPAESVLALIQTIGYPADKDLDIDPKDSYVSWHDDENSYFLVEWNAEDRTLAICAEQHTDLDSVPPAFWKALGHILKGCGLEFIEFGIAHYADKPSPGSHGGGAFRVYQDGQVVYPEMRYPTYEPSTP